MGKQTASYKLGNIGDGAGLVFSLIFMSQGIHGDVIWLLIGIAALAVTVISILRGPTESDGLKARLMDMGVGAMLAASNFVILVSITLFWPLALVGMVTGAIALLYCAPIAVALLTPPATPSQQ